MGVAEVVRPDRRAVRSWILYDWANSAFTTTVVAAVLPVHYAGVAGATLPSAASATSAFALTTSIALGVTAVLSPVLGAWSDLVAAKKRLLGVFVGVAAIATAALVGVGEGDWLLASVLFAIGRVGFGAANVVYDALLPAVAAPADRDRVSAQGYALGYLGGGLLLAVNVVMILALPDGDLGVRASFVTVAVWWALFTLPLLRNVPEPPPTAAAGARVVDSLRQVRRTFADLSRFRDLRRFLVAFVVYNDGVNTVIGVAALYGTELGFGATDLVLAILLVQFVGVPYSLAFGRVADPSWTARRRGRIATVLVANVVLLPVVAIGARIVLPADVVGRTVAAPAPASGELGVGTTELPVDAAGAVAWSGQDVSLVHTATPDGGAARVVVDGTPVVVDGEQLVLDTAGPATRTGEELRVRVEGVGSHVLELEPVRPGPVVVTAVDVHQPRRDADLGVVLGLVLAVQLVVLVLAWLLGPTLGRAFGGLDTRSGILLALAAYGVVAVWGFALGSVVEFWSLAWLVAVVQGGSQALSRSLYSVLAPERRAGEFFGLFSVLSKAAAFASPLLFVVSVAIWDSSRPAVLALGAVFAVGAWLLVGVDVRHGAAAADAEDERLSGLA